MDQNSDFPKQAMVEQPALPNKTNNRKYAVIIILLSILLIASLAFGIMEFLQNMNLKEVKTASEQNKPEEDTTKQLSLKEIFGDLVKPSKDVDEPEDDTKQNDTTGKQGTIVYQPEESDVPVIISGSIIATMDSEDEAIDLLVKKNFIKDKDYTYAWPFETTVSTYVKDNIICTVSSFDVACADEKDFPTSYETINALAKVYSAATGRKPNIVGANFEVADGLYPAQKATIAFGNASSLFYRKDKNSDWVYFTSLQAPTYCSAYDTDDLKKAFAGDACYLEDGLEMSTVTYEQ